MKDNFGTQRLFKLVLASSLLLSLGLSMTSCRMQDENGESEHVDAELQSIGTSSKDETALAGAVDPNQAPTSPLRKVSPKEQKSKQANRTQSTVLSEEKIASNPTPRSEIDSLSDRSPQNKPEAEHNTESYDRIYENPFLEALKNPLSTFSIDVDTASYANTRRFIEQQNQLPPADAVRIEEFINYFPYHYPEPSGKHPFSVSSDLSTCPWQPAHKLLRIGLKGKSVSFAESEPSNLVFLLDVSGSMDAANKLPLLKRSLKLVVDQMREEDHLSIVVYAGAAGVVLPPTSGAKKEVILDALDRLEAGGSTAGSEGIKLAYETAQKHFRKAGNNRVILATDGDFNVGPSSDAELTRLIEEKRKQGVFLTVLGFGMGNYKDSKMEKLADTGNGNYAYIDSLNEARKVLVEEMGSTLLTIAKDVKLQLEFNPAKVKSYRLIGYENRLLAAEDFDDDSKDAGELGAGTTVTALYEITPADGQESTHHFKYLSTEVRNAAKHSNELLSVKLRYKPPTSDTSTLLKHVVLDQVTPWEKVVPDFRFAAAVASYGMQLRQSEYKGQWGLNNVLTEARRGLGNDPDAYRQNFLKLASQTQKLQDDKVSQRPH